MHVLFIHISKALLKLLIIATGLWFVILCRLLYTGTTFDTIENVHNSTAKLNKIQLEKPKTLRHKPTALTFSISRLFTSRKFRRYEVKKSAKFTATLIVLGEI